MDQIRLLNTRRYLQVGKVENSVRTELSSPRFKRTPRMIPQGTIKYRFAISTDAGSL